MLPDRLHLLLARAASPTLLRRSGRSKQGLTAGGGLGRSEIRSWRPASPAGSAAPTAQLSKPAAPSSPAEQAALALLSLRGTPSSKGHALADLSCRLPYGLTHCCFRRSWSWYWNWNWICLSLWLMGPHQFPFASQAASGHEPPLPWRPWPSSPSGPVVLRSLRAFVALSQGCQTKRFCRQGLKHQTHPNPAQRRQR